MNGFGSVLPTRNPSESAEAFLDRLMPALESSFYALTGPAAANTYDDQGRVILGPKGHTVYRDDGTIAIAPNLIQIDTDDLAEGAVQLAQTDIPTLVLANKAIFGDAIVLSLLAGDLEAVTAEIDNLKVNDANIANLSVTKLLAGTIGVNGVYIGSPAFELAGADRQLRVRDTQAVPVTRVQLGRLGGGAADYGLVIRNAAGTEILNANGLGVFVVGTGNLAYNAATGPISAYTNNQIPLGSTWTNAQSVTVTVTEPDSVVYLSFTCSAQVIADPGYAATVQGRLVRGGSSLVTGSNVAYAPAGGTSYQAVTITADDSPGVGTWTYNADLQWISSAFPSACTVQARHLFAVELKR
ncbi:hypothetical protein Sp245p_03575 [Azospirillum baldaniorum]|uniref:Uncharacterized protein n=1 Tax=Azospirillum baldaniorum TaxID=1064539 RepID=A0A9P1JT92_9PROT|nr:hypothetical protein [Azospirillum baldaniorum]AWJ88934.1 hypothetical protein Sp245p_03575 [Azospirillum baldaniorum]TWA73354.1 hypothetical protein FBZ85_11646 [Azospirillum brasilense]CCC99353.1 protein of unknown function [Azospirillum baldaniorum]